MSSETRIDLVFPGVGRINRRITANPKVIKRIKLMLYTLIEDGRLDVVRAIRDKHVGFLEVYDAYQRKALEQLPIGDTMPMLETALAAWIENTRSEYSANHTANLLSMMRKFAEFRPKARVADIADVLEKLRESPYAMAHARQFNYYRAGSLAFVRSTLKKSHPLWLACSAVEMRKVTRAPERRKPLEPKEFAELFPVPDTDFIDAISWTMVTSGMHQKEYWGQWETRRDRIHIRGTKRDGRVRDIPLLRAPVVPPCSRDWFEKSFRERHRGVITPYDLRRTYSRWMELSGIPRTRRKLYMGHGASDVTDLYEFHEVEAFLVEDAKRLRAYCETQVPELFKRPPESPPISPPTLLVG